MGSDLSVISRVGMGLLSAIICISDQSQHRILEKCSNPRQVNCIAYPSKSQLRASETIETNNRIFFSNLRSKLTQRPIRQFGACGAGEDNENLT